MKKQLFYVLCALMISIGTQAQTILISPTGDGGFETGSTFAANNWSLTSATQPNQWVVGVNATAGFSGANAAYISNSYSTTTTHSYVNTASSGVHFYRDVTVPAGESNILLSFKWLCQGEGVAWDKMRVWLVPTSFTPTAGLAITSTGVAPSGRIQAGLTNYNLQSTWTTANVTIPAAYAGTSFRLVFEWTNDGSGGTIPPAGIDDIALISSSCVVPTSLNVSSVLPTSANYTWTAGGTETAWDVYYGTSPLTPPTATTVPTATTSTNSYSATGLTSALTYSVYVRANCGPTDKSVWTPAIVFTTPCVPIASLPWTEGFEGLTTVGATILPSCWTYTNLVGSNSPGTYSVTDIYRGPRTGTRAMYNQWNTTSWVFTPAFQLTAGVSYDFSFYMSNKSGVLPFTLDVAYGNSATAAGMTNTLLAAYSATNTGYTEFKYTIVPSSTGTYYFGTKGTSIDSNPWYLSFDDFSLMLTPACVQPSGITTSAMSTTSVNLSWTAPSGSPVAYNWEVRTSGAPGSGGAVASGTVSAPTTSANATGLAASTTYTAYVRTDCGGGNYSSWSMTTFYTGYCIPAPTSVDEEGIINVNINGGEIDNPSTDEPGHYGDYTSLTANVFQGTSVPAVITYSTGYTYDTKIWIDFNDDLDFNDAGEEVFSGVSTAALPTTLNANINIPLTAPLGTHRLRIGGVDVGPVTPCYNGSYGAFEDYSINIQTAPPCTLTPVAGTISGPLVVNTGSTNSYTISPAAGNLQWYSAPALTGPWTPIAGATSTIQSITAVGNGTVYYGVIASNAGCVNDTTNVQLAVTINFPGDAVCNSIPLSMGTSAPYNVFGASTQTGEVAPPATGFSNNTGWGDNILHNTMWFSFVAPASGYVTVQSPGFDTQLAVWKANACNDLLSAATATLIAANDDDGDYVAHGGALYSSFVHAACLTPGATYYIQLDSYDPAVSTNSTTIVITDMGSPLNTSFTGLSANYCLPTGNNTLTPALTGGIFTINTSTTSVSSFSASSAGTYTVNYALYGCKSSSVTSVNPNPTVTVVASNTAICNGSSATFTASGATNYTWSPVGGTSAIAVVSPTTTSTYSVVGQSALGCLSTQTVALVVNNGPTLSISPSSTVICSGGASSATLTASSSSSNYTWSPSGNNSAVEVVSPSSNAVYTVTSNNAGCVSTATVAIGVSTTPTVTATTSNNNFCSGSSATLTASGASNYTWSPSGDLTSVSIVTPGSNTTYTVVGVSSGCSATATVALMVTATPTVSASASSTAICTSSSATLTAVSSTADYTWTPAGGTSNIAIVSPSSSTTYTVTSTNGSCVGTATVSVTVLSAPTLTVSPTNILTCSGSTVALTASGASTYTWSSGGGNAATAVFTPTAMATYTVNGSNICGNASATATVNVESPLTLNASTSATLICSGVESATLSVTGTATSFTWSPGGQTTANIVVSPTITTIYTVTTSNACGVVTSTVSQNVQNCTGIEELFTTSVNVYPNPTTDVVNFSIPSHLVGQVKLEMYDALGKLVAFEDLTKELTTLKVAKFEPGVYMFKLISNNGEVKIGRLVKH